MFHLSDHIREELKYFDTSRAEILRELSEEGYCEVYALHEVTDDAGDIHGTRLRLNITRSNDSPQQWKIALKLHDIRIDGIDFETRYVAHDRNVYSGWHRHGFDQVRRDKDKYPLPIFGNNLRTLEDFLIRAFSEMKIAVNRDDNDNARLRFD